SQRAQAGRDAIGVVEAKAGIAHGERCNLARAVHRRERLSRDSFVIWWGKDHAAHHTCRLRQRPSATPVRFEMRGSLQRRFFPSLLAFLNVAPHESGSGTKRTCSSYRSMSASLIGRLGSSAFRLSTNSSVDVAHGLALLFGLGTKGPSIMGIRRRGGTIF